MNLLGSASGGGWVSDPRSGPLPGAGEEGDDFHSGKCVARNSPGVWMATSPPGKCFGLRVIRTVAPARRALKNGMARREILHRLVTPNLKILQEEQTKSAG